MGGYLTALLLALMPAAGNFAGGLLAEFFRVSQRSLSFALHAAAGIVLAVVGIELVPEALATGPAWLMLLALLAGGGFAIAVDWLLDLVQTRGGDLPGERAVGPWSIYFGVSVDLFSDGIMIGTGSIISPALGLLLALAQVPADVPEGFATIATFRRKGFGRSLRLLLAASFALPILAGTTLGYWAVRGQPDAVKFALLAFTAGILLTVAIEEIVVQAHQQGPESRWASLFLVGGFVLFAAITTYAG